MCTGCVAGFTRAKNIYSDIYSVTRLLFIPSFKKKKCIVKRRLKHHCYIDCQVNSSQVKCVSVKFVLKLYTHRAMIKIVA